MYENDIQVNAPADVPGRLQVLTDDELAACAGGGWPEEGACNGRPCPG